MPKKPPPPTRIERAAHDLKEVGKDEARGWGAIILIVLALMAGTWPWWVWQNTVTGWAVGVPWLLGCLVLAVAAETSSKRRAREDQARQDEIAQHNRQWWKDHQ